MGASTPQERILKASGRSTRRFGSILWTFPILTFGLGCWQVYRLKWKMDIIDDIKSRMVGDPIAISDLQVLQNVPEYQRVRVCGRFVHDQAMFLGPRGRSDVSHDGGGVFSGTSNTGYYVVTPMIVSSDTPRPTTTKSASWWSWLGFRSEKTQQTTLTPQNVEDNGFKILVNRGWVPLEYKTQPPQTTSQTTTIEAIKRNGEFKTSFMPENDPQTNHWYYMNVPEMAAWTDAKDLLVESIMDGKMTTNVVPVPRRSEAEVRIRNNHLEYAITWYGLSIASALLLRRF